MTARRRAWLIAAFVGVLLLAVTAVGVLYLRDEPIPRLARASAAAPTAFTPYETRFEPDWLPRGFALEHRWSQTTQQGYLAQRRGDHEWERIQIQLGPRNGTLLGFRAPRQPTWKGLAIPGTAYLLWEWAPGAPALVEVGNRKDAREVAQRVAASLRITGPQPVRYPFTVRQPAGYTVEITSTFHETGGEVRSSVGFGPGDPDIDIGVLVYPSEPPLMSANTTVRGLPARIYLADQSASVNVQLAHAVAQVNCHHPDQPAADLRAACVATAETVRLVGDPRDPATWRTPPVHR
ncbi:hypothetical protein [Cryptosporangium aurantiacum]|uniref:Uncharacterized protein n=1 Tax=Cryptosporangium aurantiacum TaxID=134849 RepID=A0A1M7RN60_9ACTN|nr:hypothetical protein [Cryptosporangium aurantiacum]SHN47777.1 hypothetical protein SAMN05443668_1284 [Cryptosporangium aurantiacum]